MFSRDTLTELWSSRRLIFYPPKFSPFFSQMHQQTSPTKELLFCPLAGCHDISASFIPLIGSEWGLSSPALKRPSRKWKKNNDLIIERAEYRICPQGQSVLSLLVFDFWTQLSVTLICIDHLYMCVSINIKWCSDTCWNRCHLGTGRTRLTDFFFPIINLKMRSVHRSSHLVSIPASPALSVVSCWVCGLLVHLLFFVFCEKKIKGKKGNIDTLIQYV